MLINAGKSLRNEDQACLRRAMLERPESRERNMRGIRQDLRKMPSSPECMNPATCLPYIYFALFDGHAGTGAAVAAANQLHHILHEKLVDVIDHLLPPLDGYMQLEASTKHGTTFFIPEKAVDNEALITGALESAFWDMDQLIGEDKQKYKVKGGCTALVALFILGKLYIANAGDSRAVLCKSRCPIPMSNDFTPESERQRVRQLAALQPELLGEEFTHLYYNRRPSQRDLGKRILYRDAHMTGWAYKTVTPEDLKIPVVYGEGKRSRVLATIGVTRGFGDHDLKALNSNIAIKPFLLSQPEVQILDIQEEEIKDSDVLIMGTDGLWDVTSNEKAVEIVQRSLDHFPANDKSRLKYRYTSAAQDLVMHSRGKLYEKNWKTADGKAATIDDISVFVIPLAPYKEEYTEWKQEYEAIHGIYETSCETSEGFGKLSLKTSPIATGKAVMSGLAIENSVNRDSLPDSLGDSSASNIPLYSADIALKIDDKTCALASGQDNSVLVIENTSSGDNLSSHYNCGAEVKGTPPSSEKSASSKEGEEDYASVHALMPCTDTHTTSELNVFCQPKDLSQKPNTLTHK
ncbi:protein phosphatase 1H isoform X2 [Cryptotermes secundus]|uniref:protein phosphatase 1H isoform X2 n=1 Tax=Cryptotermes secundus TaxID=105785 RepID=UPI000CD7D6F9|nr:protein phosphatase 1H isoform X2 [Cryptotermes secundus]